MESTRTIVIMAGGSGERFWPLSRRCRPKQMLPLGSSRPMLVETVERARLMTSLANIYVVAGPHLVPAIREMLEEIPGENVLTEPEGRNTAACIAFAAGVVAGRRGEDATMGVLAADSRIADLHAFHRNADLAFEHAATNPALVTLGIRPTHPNTGFGYLQLGPRVGGDQRGTLYKVEAFREKPDDETARRYLESGDYLWNSGMFFWKVRTLLDSFEKHEPAFAAGARAIAAEPGPGEALDRVVREAFSTWPAIAIDYAVMEKADNVCAVAAEFDWDDVGTWTALDRIHPCDDAGNLISGACTAIDTTGCIVYNHDAQDGGASQSTHVATLGLRDLLIVHTGDSLLICPKDRAQDIKQVLKVLRDKGLEDHL